MEQDYLFKVKTIDDFYLPKGSCVHVKKELATEYQGDWGSMGGTIEVKIPKDICIKLEN